MGDEVGVWCSLGLRVFVVRVERWGAVHLSSSPVQDGPFMAGHDFISSMPRRHDDFFSSCEVGMFGEDDSRPKGVGTIVEVGLVFSSPSPPTADPARDGFHQPPLQLWRPISWEGMGRGQQGGGGDRGGGGGRGWGSAAGTIAAQRAASPCSHQAPGPLRLVLFHVRTRPDTHHPQPELLRLLVSQTRLSDRPLSDRLMAPSVGTLSCGITGCQCFHRRA